MKINSIIMAMVLVIAGCGKQKEANTKADIKAKSKSAEKLGIPFDDDDAVRKQLKKDNPTPDQSRVNVLAVPPHAHYSGTVLSAKGTPVPGASVFVYAAGTKVKGKLFKGESAGTTKFASFLDLTSAAQDVSSTGWNLSGHHAFETSQAHGGRLQQAFCLPFRNLPAATNGSGSIADRMSHCDPFGSTSRIPPQLTTRSGY